MESTGSLKTVEEIFQASTVESASRSSYSIQLNETGHLQPLGQHAQSSRMNHAEFTKSCITQRMLAKSGIISQIMFSTSNGVSQNRQKIKVL